MNSEGRCNEYTNIHSFKHLYFEFHTFQTVSNIRIQIFEMGVLKTSFCVHNVFFVNFLLVTDVMCCSTVIFLNSRVKKELCYKFLFVYYVSYSMVSMKSDNSYLMLTITKYFVFSSVYV